MSVGIDNSNGLSTDNDDGGGGVGNDVSTHAIKRRSAEIVANVGGRVVLECELSVHEEGYMIKWSKLGIQVPIIIVVSVTSSPPHIDNGFFRRIRIVNEANLEIIQIREEDEGYDNDGGLMMEIMMMFMW
ncbi:hypothetical protein HELRODRAFT_181944 [Helobdella robusta]|uniref:Ig-like domain-containing protein n=1 Tax=Helobdella robusta TaxID=6412 RepID=T1FHH6_HELRO|nr:hypothetical protein HELRODRAFT_181944 [Helobdella robusta]ESN92014.1 hypothetical protein HELRODRAFT_181944 [Helobdella robusta]